MSDAIGKRVMVIAKHDTRYDWVPAMDYTIGEFGVVVRGPIMVDNRIELYRVELRTGASWYYEREALQFEGEPSTEAFLEYCKDRKNRVVIREENSHAGMIYNPYSGKWSFL